MADAHEAKDGGENVKLKLASEDRVVGVQMLLRNLGNEETSKETLLRLNSKNNSEKFESSVLIMPGIEGVASLVWNTIATSINLPTFILQMMDSPNCESLGDIVQPVIEEIKAKVFNYTKQDFFFLVGYSFGSFVTLEIARRLEEVGMKGHVMLIDGAPTFLKQLSFATLGTTDTTASEQAIQTLLIHAICLQIFPDANPDELFMNVLEQKTWSDQLDRLVEFGKKARIEYSEQYMRDIVAAMYSRLKLVFAFDTDNVQKIKSSISLVRPTEVSVLDIDEDYDLAKHTEGTVSLKFVEGNHTTMLDNEKLIQLINDSDPNQASNRSFTNYIWSGTNA